MDRLDRRGFLASSARVGLGLAAGAWAATSILEAAGVSDGISGIGTSRAAAAEIPSSTQGPKIGGFTKSFQDRPIPEVCRMFQQIGLDGLDLTVRPKGHIEPEQAAQELPKAVAAAKEAGVEILFLTTAITDADDTAERLLAMAGEQGIRCVKLGYYRYQAFGTLAAQLAEIRKRLADVAKLAAKHGVLPCVHVHSGTFIPSHGTQLYELLRDFSPQEVGAYLDTGHMALEGGGDGEIEIVSAQNYNRNDNHFTSSVAVQKLDGRVLWRWGNPKLGRRELHHDVACQIHDLDHNGASEVILAGDRRLIVLDGRSGEPASTFPVEQDASDCVVFADLSGKGWPSEILVKTRYGQIWAYSADGRLLWTVKEPGNYPTAHQPLPVDLDGDGRDEILAGYAALDPDGSLRWVFQAEKQRRNGGHADCWRVVRLAERAEDTRLVMTMCGGNALVMTDGAGQLVWRATGHHYESVDVGDIRDDVPGLELVVDIDHLPAPPKPLCLFDQRGSQLGRINTDYTRHHILVDWNGDGLQEIGSAIPRGLFDGRGRRVCCFAIEEGERPRLMAAVDLTGHGTRDVLLTTIKEGIYKAYLYRNKTAVPPSRERPGGTGLNFTLY